MHDCMQNDFAHICYQFDITCDELMEKADAICESLMTYYAYADVQYCVLHDEDGNEIERDYYFRVVTELPSLYMYKHNASHTIGVVQAFSVKEAKRKIREQSDLTADPDEITEILGDVYEDSM